MTSDLITRLSKLDAPDREVDAEIAFATGHFDYKLKYGFENCHIERGEKRTDDWVEVLVKDRGTLIYGEPYPHYTASVDAVIALAERVLPGWTWYLGFGLRLEGDMRAIAGFYPNNRPDSCVKDDHPIPAIALLIALLRAKEASNAQ